MTNINRRQFIARGAAAGAVAWAAPAIISSPAWANGAGSAVLPPTNDTPAHLGPTAVGVTPKLVVGGEPTIGRPLGIFAAGSGVVYIADLDQDASPPESLPGRILLYDPSKGSGAAGLSTLVPAGANVTPSDVAVDGADTLYLTNKGSANTVLSCPQGGSLSVFAGGFADPNFLAIAAAPPPAIGQFLLYVSDGSGKQVWKVPLGGATGTPAVLASLPSAVYLTGIAASATTVYVADQGTAGLSNGAIYSIDAVTGTPTTYLSGLDEPEGIALDSGGNLYILLIHGTVLRVAAGTMTQTTVANFGALVDTGNDVAIDPVTGDLYITDQTTGGQGLYVVPFS